MKLALLVSAGLHAHAIKELEAKSPLEVADEMCALAELVSPAALADLRRAIKAKTENKENNARVRHEMPRQGVRQHRFRDQCRLADV